MVPLWGTCLFSGGYSTSNHPSISTGHNFAPLVLFQVCLGQAGVSLLLAKTRKRMVSVKSDVVLESWWTMTRQWSFQFLAYFEQHMSHEKNPPTFHYTGWLIGILIMVYHYHDPYIIGLYNPLFALNNQGFFHCSHVWGFLSEFSTNFPFVAFVPLRTAYLARDPLAILLTCFSRKLAPKQAQDLFHFFPHIKKRLQNRWFAQ